MLLKQSYLFEHDKRSQCPPEVPPAASKILLYASQTLQNHHEQPPPIRLIVRTRNYNAPKTHEPKSKLNGPQRPC